jgi:hypothetical protein
MPLPRLHLFELEDLAFFPAFLRDLSTDYLHFMETKFGLHQPIVRVLKRTIEGTRQGNLVDLCSGGRGPLPGVIAQLAANGLSVEATLTDKFPNAGALSRLAALDPTRIRFRSDSIDAASAPRDLVGIRTMFNAFHHFAPAEARAVLQDAVRSRQPICIFDIPERSVPMLFPFFVIPLYVWLATPFIQPFRLSRLLLTYVLPIVPLTCWWDGLVSAMRAYTREEMLWLARGLDDFQWDAGRLHFRAAGACDVPAGNASRPSGAISSASRFRRVGCSATPTKIAWVRPLYG